MSSTLTVTNLTATNITDGGGTTSTFANINSGSAKAWINFDGTLADSSVNLTGVRGSFNVASLVEGGTGIYTLNWSSAMSNSNYCLVGMSGEMTGGGNRGVGIRGTTQAPAPSTCAFLAHNSNTGSAEDLDVVCISVNGDLA